MTEQFKEPLKKDNSGIDELDDIFSFGDGFVAPSKNEEKVEKIDNSIMEEKCAKKEDENTPSLRGSDFPSDYLKMVDRIKTQYLFLPKLDHDSISKEMSELSIKSCPTPTLQVLNDEIQKVQAAKDRLSEIFIDVIKVYNFKKRAVDILQDSWGKFTSEKNAEARKGDSAFRLSDFSLDFANVEGLLKAITHVFRNLDGLQDSLSRRITIYQLLLNKLHDMGRNSLPDYEFDKTGSQPDIFTKEESNKEGGGEPKLEGF